MVAFSENVFWGGLGNTERVHVHGNNLHIHIHNKKLPTYIVAQHSTEHTAHVSTAIDREIGRLVEPKPLIVLLNLIPESLNDDTQTTTIRPQSQFQEEILYSLCRTHM